MTRSAPSPPAGRAGALPLVEVAVPLPIPGPLTYEVPEIWSRLARPGSRVKVRVGRRRLTGVILRQSAAAPEGIEVRALEEVVDAQPILSPELLELARFGAEYYLAPIGEVLRTMLPADLGAWGARRVRLTTAGAFARPRSEVEGRIVELLMTRGAASPAELGAELGAEVDDDELSRRLRALQEAGRLRIEERGEGSGHYRTGVELPRGDLEAQLEACGRSTQGRAVVEYLAALGRPASVEEVTQGVGCGAAVVRRLVKLRVLRSFTQLERLTLDRHLLAGAPTSPITLRDDQQEALAALLAAVRSGRFAPFLLRGMTGAGKTEVYLRAAEEVLGKGGSALLLVPEIALVPALAAAARQRFGERLALLHSGLRRSERQQEWERVRGGDARVVLGPRSAVFAPLAGLGLVVVDEEQDGSYKQESSPRYNGRDLALVRAQHSGAVAVLVSATPSLETRHNVERHRYGDLVLRVRAGQGRMPRGILVDLRQETAARRPGEVAFSGRLCEEVDRSLEAGEQIILLRNRRGYAPMLLCRACGEDFRCDDCGLPRTFHRREGRLICHYCGSLRALPAACPSCQEGALEPIGAGTERVEEDFLERFPQATVGVLDRDSVRRRGGAAAVLERFRNGETRVLIGTQMVSKGHHFPNVALTVVLSADTYLRFPDFRAVERTYSLLTQLAGRAGRGERPGRVVIQTYHPDHYAIRAALDHDDAGFAREEMRFRRVFHYPPFSRMVQLLWRDKDRQRGEEGISELAAELERHPLSAGMRMSGPAPAPLERLRGQWRYQLLLRSASGGRLRRLVREVAVPKAAPALTIDVDPYDLM